MQLVLLLAIFIPFNIALSGASPFNSQSFLLLFAVPQSQFPASSQVSLIILYLTMTTKAESQLDC
jgi:hypothetical protein